MRRALITALLVLGYSREASAVVPSGFTEESFLSNELTQATGAVWAPDGSGRLFVLTKTGIVRVVRTAAGRPITNPNGSLALGTFATEPSVHTNSECGLLGIAFDPNYVVNRYLYVFVTVSASEQQIVRYTDVGGGPDAAGSGEERTVLISKLPTNGEDRDGGGLAIGADGKLYFSIGDLGNATGVSADLTSLASKVGRANLDGTPVDDNPFFDGVGPNNEYIWARGLRNPFGLFRQPTTGSIWTTVAGDSYEQAFLLAKGSNAGYNTYENNQPAPYLPPKIAYRTNSVDTRNLASTARTGGILTGTTVSAHRFRVGQRLHLSGVDASVDGDVYVRSVPSTTTFTATQAGPDVNLGAGGSATTDALGGSITRGTFYDATAFPTEYRGNLFFGDFNTGQLVRAVLSSTNEVQQVDEWGTGFASNIQVASGDDGALYTLGFTGGRLRRVSSASTTPRIVVAGLMPRVPEGGRATFAVSLATAPAANVDVTVTRSSGDPDIGVLSGGTLSFTPTDWAQPRPVVLTAAYDADLDPDVTTFDVAAAGFATEQVTATSIERSGPHLVLSTEKLHVPEGGQAAMTVAWSGALTKTTTVTIRRTRGDADLDVVDPTTLTFAPASATTPQTVTFAAPQDEDGIAGTAEFAFASVLDSRALDVVEDDDEAPPPDAGDDAGTQDAGTQDAGSVDAGAGDAGNVGAAPADASTAETLPDGGEVATAPGEAEGGCNGCSVPGSTAPGALWIVPALLLRRRRRKLPG